MQRLARILFVGVLLIGSAVGALFLTQGEAVLAGPNGWDGALEKLESGNANLRAQGVLALVNMGRGVLQDLLTALENQPSALRAAGLAEAVRGIGIGAGDVASVTPLLDVKSPVTRHAAITILAQQAAGARTALEALGSKTAERPALRASAALALGGAGPQARGWLRRAAFDAQVPDAVRKASLRSLAGISTAGASDVKSLAADVEQPWALRRVAILALGKAGALGDAPLAALLASSEERVRVATIEALTTRGGPSSVTLVAGRVTDLSADVRYAALRGLMLMEETAPNRTAVIGRMLDADPRVQALAAQEVGRHCGDIAASVRPALVSLLASTNFQVRYEAALALFAHGDTSGAPTMKADTLSTNPSVARQALAAFNQIMGQ